MVENSAIEWTHHTMNPWIESFGVILLAVGLAIGIVVAFRPH